MSLVEKDSNVVDREVVELEVMEKCVAVEVEGILSMPTGRPKPPSFAGLLVGPSRFELGTAETVGEGGASKVSSFI